MRSPYETDFCVHKPEEHIHYERPEEPSRYTHEYKPYFCKPQHEDLVQADWNECNPRKASFIKNKPNVVLGVNFQEPDKHGIVHVNANDLGVEPISNSAIYVEAEKIFKELR